MIGCRCPSGSSSPGSVTSITSSRSRRSSSSSASVALARLDRRLEPLPDAVQEHPALAVAHLAQRQRERALAPEVARRAPPRARRGRRRRARARLDRIALPVAVCLRPSERSRRRVRHRVGRAGSIRAAVSAYDRSPGSTTRGRRASSRTSPFYLERGAALGRAGRRARRRHRAGSRSRSRRTGSGDRRRLVGGDARGRAGAGRARGRRARPPPRRLPRPAGRGARSARDRSRSARCCTCRPTSDRRAAVRAVARGCSSRAGRFVFDVFSPGAGRHRRDARPLARARAGDLRARRLGRARAGRSILRVRGEGAEAELSLAWLSSREWRELLGEEGFVVEGLYGWFDRTPVARPRGLDLGLPQRSRASSTGSPSANAARLRRRRSRRRSRSACRRAGRGSALIAAQRVERADARVRILGRHGAARHRPARRAPIGLADPHAVARHVSSSCGSCPSSSSSMRKRRASTSAPSSCAEPLAGGAARRSCRRGRRCPCAGLVGADELQRPRPRSRRAPPPTGPRRAARCTGRPQKFVVHRLAELDRRPSTSRPSGKRSVRRAVLDLGHDPHERPVILAVEEPPARDQVEAPVLPRRRARSARPRPDAGARAP